MQYFTFPNYQTRLCYEYFRAEYPDNLREIVQKWEADDRAAHDANFPDQDYAPCYESLGNDIQEFVKFSEAPLEEDAGDFYGDMLHFALDYIRWECVAKAVVLDVDAVTLD